MRKQDRGFSLIEVLIALAVIIIGLVALSASQVTNLRASVVSRTATDTKSAANRELERLMALVLEVVDGGEFAFTYYYWGCPPPGSTEAAKLTAPTPCMGASPTLTADIEVDFLISAEPGILGEGVLSISVTAVHDHTNQRLSIGDRITCYDVYPSPSATAPEPCPTPTTSGSGWSL